VLSGLDLEHHVLICEDAGDGVDAAGEGLSEKDHVGLDVVPFAAEHSAGSAKAL
jgi:hypothetical protein